MTYWIPPTPSSNSRFSTFSELRKEDDKPFFDPTEPLTEEEKKANNVEKTSVDTKEDETSPISKKESSTGSPSNGRGDGNDAKGTSAQGSGTSGQSSDGSGDGGRRSRKDKSSERSLEKPRIPEVYPQVMAIPIAKRPLFPGFYKAININDPNVAQAILDMFKRGQPYVGAFMLKDDNANKDVIDDPNEVHDVGVFAQITSAFPMHSDEKGLTAILYPHRRIKMSELIPPSAYKSEPNVNDVPEPIPQKSPEESNQIERKGDIVASFEESAIESKKESKDLKERVLPTSFLRRYPVSLVNVENLTEEPHDPKSPVIRAVTNEIVNVFKEVASMNQLFRDQISTFSLSQSGTITSEPARLADFAAAVSAGEPEELQGILASMNVEDRMHKALVVLKKELMNAQLQSKITKEVETKITKRQREYWLMEQMKGIKRELGIESDGKDKLVEEFKKKADALAMPEAVRKVFDDEINKLAHLEPAASEFNVTRNYLDWLTQVPWGKRSNENFAIKNAMKVLDEDHYGLKDVKDRILEFIAVGKLRGTVEGKILCFVGPPGVGKTSIGKSIARALNRKYYRFSVGGLTDVAEIKGHRRTYVGALPGRVIQALKKCQTENPLILIDEIDKIGKGYQGDPASALLELLDPEQNNSFLDHYMDVPVDLSKVLFVCTANLVNTIPQPLLDRMEVIRLTGYVADEKMAIAEKYLAPQAKELAGLKEANVTLAPEAVEELIKSYCRESGVRNLKKQIEKVYRKSALQIVQDIGEEPTEEEKDKAAPAGLDETKVEASSEISQNSETESSETASTTSTTDTEIINPPKPLRIPDSVHFTIQKENLSDYVGPPIYTSDRLFETAPPGVAMGLAVSGMGGSAMYVEAILSRALKPDGGSPSLNVTGNLRKVMEESGSIAYTFAKGYMVNNFPDNHFFDKAKIHVHVPEGAISKDGPSAGITIATSLLSLATETPVHPDIAMTGELTLTGKVLRIGGLREKTVAAKRAGCKIVIFPQDNMSDWLELSDVSFLKP